MKEAFLLAQATKVPSFLNRSRLCFGHAGKVQRAESHRVLFCLSHLHVHVVSHFDFFVNICQLLFGFHVFIYMFMQSNSNMFIFPHLPGEGC